MFRYIAKYNIHLGLAAAISGLSYATLVNDYFDFYKLGLLSMLQFLSVVAAYNYFRKRFKLSWQIPISLAFGISFFYNFNVQLYLLLAGFIAFLYQLPTKNKIGLRFYPFLKPFIIGLCWAIIVVLLPSNLFVGYNSQTDFVTFIFVIKFLEVSALCIANDLLHIPKDKVSGLKTFPIAYGITVSKISILLLPVFQILLPFFMISIALDDGCRIEYNQIFYFMSIVIAYLLVVISVVLIHFKKNRGVEYFLDIIIGIEALALLSLNYYFIYFLKY